MMYDDSYDNLFDVKKYICSVNKWVKHRPTVALLVTGPPGSGKTHFTVEYLKHQKYKTFLYNSSNFQNQCTLTTTLSNIYQNVNLVASNKIAIVFDELESASINDKGCISGIVNFINMLNKYKLNLSKKIKCDENYNLDILLICIGQNSYIKKIKQLQKICTQLDFHSPPDDILAEIIKKYKPDIDQTERAGCIKSVQNDYRKLKLMITSDDWSNTNQKWYNMYTITEHMLYSYQPLDTIIRHYNNQKIFLPLMVHENYKNSIFNSCKKNVYKHLYHLSRIISDSDTIGKYIFNNNARDLNTYYVLKSCYNVCHYIHNIPDKNKNIKRSPINFTMLMNRSSLQCTYKHTYSKHVVDFYDYHMDRDVVKFNTLKMMALYEKDPEKYGHLLNIYKIQNDKNETDVKILTKISNSV